MLHSTCVDAAEWGSGWKPMPKRAQHLRVRPFEQAQTLRLEDFAAYGQPCEGCDLLVDLPRRQPRYCRHWRHAVLTTGRHLVVGLASSCDQQTSARDSLASFASAHLSFRDYFAQVTCHLSWDAAKREPSSQRQACCRYYCGYLTHHHFGLVSNPSRQLLSAWTRTALCWMDFIDCRSFSASKW